MHKSVIRAFIRIVAVVHLVLYFLCSSTVPHDAMKSLVLVSDLDLVAKCG